MALIVKNCPHCASTKATMKLHSWDTWATNSDLINAFYSCPVCEKPVTSLLRRTRRLDGRSPVDLNSWPGTVQDGGYDIQLTWPKPTMPAAPNDVPEHIARNFIQAEHARQRDHREAAGMVYRRTLEVALKDIDPDGRGMLKARIDSLTKSGKLNEQMSLWAHSVRVLGNEASHDEPEPSKEDIDDLAAFVAITLEYLYTMPAKVVRRLPKKGSKETALQSEASNAIADG